MVNILITVIGFDITFSNNFICFEFKKKFVKIFN